MPETGWAPSRLWPALIKGESLVLAGVPVVHVLTPPLPRISLAGLEPSLVQAALGQLVQLFCQGGTSLDPHARWQKDGQPISSDRYVCGSPPSSGSPGGLRWDKRAGLQSPLVGPLGPEVGWAYCPQEPRAQACHLLTQAQAAA